MRRLRLAAAAALCLAFTLTMTIVAHAAKQTFLKAYDRVVIRVCESSVPVSDVNRFSDNATVTLLCPFKKNPDIDRLLLLYSYGDGSVKKISYSVSHDVNRVLQYLRSIVTSDDHVMLVYSAIVNAQVTSYEIRMVEFDKQGGLVFEKALQTSATDLMYSVSLEQAGDGKFIVGYGCECREVINGHTLTGAEIFALTVDGSGTVLSKNRVTPLEDKVVLSPAYLSRDYTGGPKPYFASTASGQIAFTWRHEYQAGQFQPAFRRVASAFDSSQRPIYLQNSEIRTDGNVIPLGTLALNEKVFVLYEASGSGAGAYVGKYKKTGQPTSPIAYVGPMDGVGYQAICLLQIDPTHAMIVIPRTTNLSYYIIDEKSNTVVESAIVANDIYSSYDFASAAVLTNGSVVINYVETYTTDNGNINRSHELFLQRQ